MTNSEHSLHFAIFFLLASILFPAAVLCGEQPPWLQSPIQQLSEKNYQPENAMIEASKVKAKELKYNPIPVYMKEGDNGLSITGGAILQVRNFRQTFVKDDMVINVGELPVPFANFPLLDGFTAPGKIILSKGEYAVLKDGKFVKQNGKIKTVGARQ